MLTRKHPHARDLLRRWRGKFAPINSATILNGIMLGRHEFQRYWPKGYVGAVRRVAWRQIIARARGLRETPGMDGFALFAENEVRIGRGEA